MLARVTVAAPQILFEPLRGIGVEQGRLANEVVGRREDGLHAVARHALRDSAMDELRVEPLVALLEIAAIRHLRQQVGSAEQVADLAVARVGHADAAEGDLVAGVVDDACRDRGPVGQARRRQVLGDEARAAGDVAAGEDGAVGNLAFRLLADVAGVVEQRRDQPHQCPFGAKLKAIRCAALVTGQQPRRGEHDVERVLQVVVDGVDADVAGHAAREQAGEVIHRPCQHVEFCARPAAGIEFQHGLADRVGRADLNRIGDVVVAASMRAGHDCLCLWSGP